MKKLLLYIALAPVMSLLFTGCNEFLDVAPDERLEINSLEKVEATIVGSYQNSRSHRFTDFSTDNVTAASNVYSTADIIEDLYTWSRDFRSQTHQDSPAEYWTASYGSISQLNHALEALDKLSLTPDEIAKANAIRGEVLIMRSYCHFMLVNLFAKHYDASTAGSDFGVPYVYLPEKELSVNYKRESVEQVYINAEKDLLEGLALLEADHSLVNKNKYRFTFPSIYSYAARFYTFRNKNEEDVAKAIAFGELAIAEYGGVNSMRAWKEYGSDKYGPVNIDNSEVGMVQNSRTWTTFSYIYQCTTNELEQTGILQLYLQKNPFGLRVDNRLLSSYIRTGNVFVPISFFVYQPGSVESSATDLFPLSEAILYTAEGYIRQGNYVRAKSLLEVIGRNVYEGYNPALLTTEKLKEFYSVEDDMQAWTNYLLFERRVHNLQRGLRWFDIKRYGIDVVHLLVDGSEIKLSEIAPNKDYQIPNYAIKTGMQPNK